MRLQQGSGREQEECETKECYTDAETRILDTRCSAGMMGHVVTPDGGRWWMVVAGHWYGEECWRGEVVPGHTATTASGPTITLNTSQHSVGVRPPRRPVGSRYTASQPWLLQCVSLYPDRGEGGVNRYLDI